MGVFDSIMVPCPNCGKRKEFQTKSGDRMMDTWNIEDAPENALENVNRHAPRECSCGTIFEADKEHRVGVLTIPF
jgi:predicted  nucleic acid-binding Zn-ribbon protein